MSDDEEEEQIKKKGNALPLWGNQQSMNINNLIVTNILSSPYFKNELIKLKTFHEVIDEIYYKVEHLEPWEKGSRKLHGQVGMCGGVRGVGTGGIVSSTFCLLFKLFTLKLTQKQVYVLINHVDSPYIRALGFMFIRYCQHPNTFWQWYEPYLEDDEEIDPKAGGGCTMTIGQMIRSFILKLDWYGTLFPRIPVPIHKEIESNLKAINLNDDRKIYAADEEERKPEREEEPKKPLSFGEAERYAQKKRDERKSSPSHSDGERPRQSSDRERTHHSSADRERTHHGSADRERTHRSSEKEHRHRSDDERRSSSKKLSSRKSDHDKTRKHENGHKSKHRSRDRSRDRTIDGSRDKAVRSRDRSHEKTRDRPRDRSKDSTRDRTRPRSRSKERKRSRSREKRR